MPEIKLCKLPTCEKPLPKGYEGKYCPQSDHYQQHLAMNRKVTQAKATETKKLTLASKTIPESFVSIEEQRTAERTEMYFMDTQEQLRQARKESEKESLADRFEAIATRYGSVVIPTLFVFAIGWDVGQFLFTQGDDKSWYAVIPVLTIAILFEAMLAILTFNLRGLRRDIALAPEATRSQIQKDYTVAERGWFILAFVSCVAQFAAITGLNFETINWVSGAVMAIRVIGTTGCDYAVAVCVAPRVKTVAMKAAELMQEAQDLTQLAEAFQARLVAEQKVKQSFLAMQRLQLQQQVPGHVDSIEEV